MQPDKCGYATGRNLGGKASAGKDDDVIICKGSVLRKADWMNQCKRRFYLLQISGHASTTGFICWCQGTVQAELQSDKWGNARASKMAAPLFVKDLHQCSNNTVYKTRENRLDKSRKRKETEWMNNCKPFFRQAVFRDAAIFQLRVYLLVLRFATSRIAVR